jgi:hypothetical protein
LTSAEAPLNRGAVFRTILALAVCAGTASLRAQAPPPAANPPSRAVIYAVNDGSALDLFDENPSVTRRMTDRLMLAATGQRDLAQAWRTLVKSTERVGIKISSAGGLYRSSHRGIVASVIDGLERSGVPRSRMVIWDRHRNDLRAAGFGEKWNGVAVRSIDPPRGLDAASKMNIPILGKLIWGDLMFRGKRPGSRDAADDEGLSSDSYLPIVLTKEVDRVINIATLSDEPGCGVAGALYNLTVSNLDNNRRLTQGSGATFLPDIYLDERIAPKVAIHILDGLVGQYAGGPAFQANYAFTHGTIYASKDPVALDAHASRLIDNWRSQSKLPPLGRTTSWLQEAEGAGAGVFAEDRIDLRMVPAALP